MLFVIYLRGQLKLVGLTGAVASQKITEVHKGFIRLVGNQFQSVKVKRSLTVKLTS